MNGLRTANRQIRRLLGRVAGRLPSLARWSPTAFIGAGGLLLLASALSAVEAFTALSPQGTVAGVISLPGLILPYVGLLGLYSRVAGQTPRFALGGVILIGVPAIVLLVLLVWGASGHALAVIPLPPSVIPSFGMVFTAVFLLFGLGISMFGVASLRSRKVPSTVGLLLFILAAIWFVLLGASSVYGSSFPPWLDFVSFGLMALTLLAIGVRSRQGLAKHGPGGLADDESAHRT